MKPEVSDDPERVRRFVQEAKAASALSHPNVAHVYEIGQIGSLHFIAMEYVEGKPVNARDGDKPLSHAEIAEIGIQLADALDEAPRRGIVHRDIKSANILLNARGQVKVLDFGVAKVTARAVSPQGETRLETVPGLVFGTVQYMSPE